MTSKKTHEMLCIIVFTVGANSCALLVGIVPEINNLDPPTMVTLSPILATINNDRASSKGEFQVQNGAKKQDNVVRLYE